MTATDARWATIYGAWRMADIEDGMSGTGDAPDREMKEGPGPSARDPLGEPAPPLGFRGQEELQTAKTDTLFFSFGCAEAEETVTA